MMFPAIQKLLIKTCHSGTGSGFGTGDNLICTKCAAGQYDNTTGNLGCVKCVPGRYSTQKGSTDCTACAKGRVMPGNNTGSAHESDCKRCPHGQVGCVRLLHFETVLKKTHFEKRKLRKFRKPGRTRYTLFITGLRPKCDPRYEPLLHCRYAQVPATTTKCDACAAGQYAPANVSAVRCEVCAAGRYANNVSQTKCQLCRVRLPPSPSTMPRQFRLVHGAHNIPAVVAF